MGFTYGCRNYTLRTPRMNFLGRGSARIASKSLRNAVQSSWTSAGILPGEIPSLWHNRSGKTRMPRATRWLRALLRAVYRNDGDTHDAVTSGPCPRCRVYVFHSSFRRGCNTADPNHKRHARLFYHLAISHFDPLHRSRIASAKTLALRTQRRKTSWRTNRHSINRRSFAIAL